MGLKEKPGELLELPSILERVHYTLHTQNSEMAIPYPEISEESDK